MPSTLVAPQSVAPVPPSRKHWTRSELQAISDAGLIETEKLELIEGDLIEKMGKNRPHILALSLLTQYLSGVFSFLYLQTEGPIDVSPQDNPTSEPEPDIVVLISPLATFSDTNPRPTDIRLICEVSSTTLAFDLTTKANLYARAGITEYWVLDLTNTRLIVYRDPTPNGYQSIQAYAPNESISPLAAPTATLNVNQLFSTPNHP